MNVSELDSFTLLHAATRGVTARAASALSAEFGISVDCASGAVAARPDGLTVLWFGPGRWLIHAATRAFRLEPIQGCAITDLSDSRRIFRLTGDDTGDFLAASCPLDLAESAMPIGSCALTQFDRFSVLLHRQGTDSFDLYVERSYAAALRLAGG